MIFFNVFFLMQYTDLISHSNSRQKWLKFDEAIRKLWALIRCLMIWGQAAPSPRLFGWLLIFPSHKCFLSTLTVCPAATVCSQGNLTLSGLGYTDHLFNSEASPSHVDSSNPWITRHSPLVATGSTDTNIYVQPKHISHPLSWPVLSTIPSDPWFPLVPSGSLWLPLALVRSGFDATIYWVIQANNREVIGGNSSSLSPRLLANYQIMLITFPHGFQIYLLPRIPTATTLTHSSWSQLISSQRLLSATRDVPSTQLHFTAMIGMFKSQIWLCSLLHTAYKPSIV